MHHEASQTVSSIVPRTVRSSSQKSRGKFRQRYFKALLSLALGITANPFVAAQTVAPSVRSALADPALLGGPVTGRMADTDVGSISLAGSQLPVTHAHENSPLNLSLPQDGKILSITEGEDKIIDTSDTPPPGFPTSMNSQLGGPALMPGSGYAGTSLGTQYGSGGGAYSGYAPYGSPVSNPCCPENCHDYYMSFETVFLKADAAESYTLSPGTYLGDYAFDLAGRYTVGQMLDCTDGVELVYTGPFKWNRSSVRQTQGAPLTSVFQTANGYIPSQIDTFNNSLRHIQGEEIDLQSYEANRRWFAWDIMSTLIGFRAFRYNESYLFDAVTPAPDFFAGFYRTRLENFLVGGQVGADVMRPIGQRLSVGTRTRAGIFANFNKGETLLANRGSFLINASQRDVDLAAMFQYGALARYRITKHISAIGGYEAWILAGIATVADQTYTPVTPSTGTDYEADDFVFFHGATGGIEIQF